jgi:myo-inositol-hexaphosphate 3-phosphohydrolase
MFCIKIDIPQEACDIDDELKAIYHSKDSVCIWVFRTRADRNRFMDETQGMNKEDRQSSFESFYEAED